MASRYPAAVWKPLGVQTQARMRAHDIVCLHTMVGYLWSTHSYFAQGGYAGTESHYGVGGVWGSDAGRGLDGDVWQWQDRAYMADANGQGNPRVISIETADNAQAPIASWSAAQCESLARILAWESSTAAHAACPASWACHRVGIPLVLIPDTKPHRRGVGYHRQGVRGNFRDGWVSGGELWSSSFGKVCPGDRRIAQIPGIIARARVIAGQPGGPIVDPTPGLPPVLDAGATRRVQQILAEQLDEHSRPYYSGEPDGVYGPLTSTAVAAWQADQGLTADGVWGPLSETHYREAVMVTAADRTAIAKAASDAVSAALLPSVTAQSDDVRRLVTYVTNMRDVLASVHELVDDLAGRDVVPTELRERLTALAATLDDMQARAPRVNTARYDNVAAPSYADLADLAGQQGVDYLALSGQLNGVQASISPDVAASIAEAVAELIPAGGGNGASSGTFTGQVTLG